MNTIRKNVIHLFILIVDDGYFISCISLMIQGDVSF